MTRPAGAAKLPSLPTVNTGNPALDRWIQAVSERLEVREGTRGNPHERAVTLRELRDAGLSGFGLGASSMIPGSILTVAPDGTYSSMSPGAFADSIRKSKIYKDLMLRLDDPARFDDLPEQVRAILLIDLADEAKKRGAEIQRLERKLQSATESLAYTVEEVTASVAGSMAGVRETVFASATESNATAGIVTQLTAALDGTGSATAEESLVVIADRTAGLSAQKMLKLNAGRAVVGVALMASEDPDGITESKFIVQADQFALTGAYTYMQGDASSSPPVTPPSASVAGQTWYNTRTNLSYRSAGGTWSAYSLPIPFGVNTSTGQVFINGSLTINSGGTPLQDAIGVPGPTGPTGPAGATGGAGATGIRGTIVTKIDGAWNATTANAKIAAVATAGGGTPTTPIKGDIVSYAGGANEYDPPGYPGAWGPVAAYIDGSLIVTGTIAANKVVAGTLTGFVIQTSASSSRWVMDGSLYANQLRGFFGAEGTPRMILDSSDGTVNFLARTSASINSFTGTTGSGLGLLQVANGGAGECVRAVNSGTGAGGYFAGNATKPPIILADQASKPSDATTGGLMVYNSGGGHRLCVSIAGTWYKIDATYTAI